MQTTHNNSYHVFYNFFLLTGKPLSLYSSPCTCESSLEVQYSRSALSKCKCESLPQNHTSGIRECNSSADIYGHRMCINHQMNCHNLFQISTAVRSWHKPYCAIHHLLYINHLKQNALLLSYVLQIFPLKFKILYSRAVYVCIIHVSTHTGSTGFISCLHSIVSVAKFAIM